MLAEGHISYFNKIFALILRKFRGGAGGREVIFHCRGSKLWLGSGRRRLPGWPRRSLAGVPADRHPARSAPRSRHGDAITGGAPPASPRRKSETQAKLNHFT
jgi:hypothetical protein